MTFFLNPLSPILHCAPGQRQQWGQLQGSGMAVVMSQLGQQYPLIVITADTFTAQQLVEEIEFFGTENLTLLHFPDWETLPYDVFSPHQDIISERLLTLYQLPLLEQGIIILPVTTLMHAIAPKNYVSAQSLVLHRGQSLKSIDHFRQQLENNGYRWVAQVMEHGEFSVRGSLIDLFPMGSVLPYRIDLLDNEIDSIRYFDPDTQRSQNTLEKIQLLPAREFPLNETTITQFRARWRQQWDGDPMRSPIYREVSKGSVPPGIEYYLPLFFEQTQTLFDYLPNQSVIVTIGQEMMTVAEQFWRDANERYEQLRHDFERPLLPPDQLFLQAHQVFSGFHRYPHLQLNHEKMDDPQGINFATTTPPTLPVESRSAEPLARLKQFLQTFPGRVLMTAETAGRRESLLELFKNHELIPTIADHWQQFLHRQELFMLTITPLERGLVIEIPENRSLAVLSETQLFGERVAQRRLRKKTTVRDADAVIRSFTELHIGSPVVHEEYGIGRYQGLMTLDIDGIMAEFLHLEYVDHNKLYVPVASLHLISRFTGVDPEHAPLHRLGSGQWEKAKRKAAQQVHDVAVELLDIYAQRATRQGHAFKQDIESYRAFAQAFPFEETPDQQEAIATVLADMYSSQPMDRLICGDVGFGKTEVALRASFVAVQDGQQVAVLVPTTLLAQQHYQNFQDRFADWPVRVEQLSRFCSKKQQDGILKGLASGQVDIVIGTHKLLQDQIQFKKLGLVIIDEEHRFGVRQKERFKALRSEVDILTLTATPIPRSLNMALSNLRDLSIIATPPSRRLAVKTFMREWHTPSITEAILRELKRGGQVYFLHNSVETINGIAQEIERLVPEARVKIGHGQMREKELERVMQDFYHRRFNVLVCTTIIESGIDIPNVNTIIINRADKFGLAQLYQLRGRVGRSHRRAYAYLVIPPRQAMTADAQKRLEALCAIEELGMGFTLATHDLEIRGAGEFLGQEQSGHLQEVGYTLYTELLERAITALRAGHPAELERPRSQAIEINLYSSALLPSDYLPDVHTRLIMYKRIANAPDEQVLEDLQVEMIDRFGLLPDPAKALFKITLLKLIAIKLGIRKIEMNSSGGSIRFQENPPIDPLKIVQLLQTHPQRYRLVNQTQLRLLGTFPDFSARWKSLNQLLQQLLREF